MFIHLAAKICGRVWYMEAVKYNEVVIELLCTYNNAKEKKAMVAQGIVKSITMR